MSEDELLENALDMEWGDAEIGIQLYPATKSILALITEVIFKRPEDTGKEYPSVWIKAKFNDERHPALSGKTATIFINMMPEWKEIWQGKITKLFLCAGVVYGRGQRPSLAELVDRMVDLGINVRKREDTGEEQNEFGFNVTKEAMKAYKESRK